MKRRVPPVLKVLLWLTGSALGLVVLLVTAAGIFIATNVSSKGGAPHVYSNPSLADYDVPVVPRLQLEDHTCGFLALSSAYEKYGLSPEDENLRFRLGVDKAANPADGSTTGTLHPDLYRVLRQDGFLYWTVEPGDPDTITNLRRWMDEGPAAALLLIARRENGNLHWVLADGFVAPEAVASDGDGGSVTDERLRIVDSLREEAYTEPVAAYLNERVLSLVMIAPREALTELDGLAELEAEQKQESPHLEGVREIARVRKRIKARDHQEASEHGDE